MAYKKIAHMASGSFGTVSLVEDATGARYALKEYCPSAFIKAHIQAGNIPESDLKRRFLYELRYQSSFNHPNIIRIIDHDASAEPPYFIMELATCSLEDELKTDHTLNGNPGPALFDILSGLETLHQNGIYHRDLKPANVLKIESKDGATRYAVSDFGLIKQASGTSTTYTASGTGGGTEKYAAPELMSNFKRATARSDIYSFGVILQDIFAPNPSRIPYTEVTNISGDIGKIASKCTKSLSARRYNSVQELRAALYEALNAAPPTFVTKESSHALDLLESESVLNNDQWDEVFLALESDQITEPVREALLRKFNKQHIEQLQHDAPDLLAAYTDYFCSALDSKKGSLDFNYCDIAGDKLEWLFLAGDVNTKARTLISLLIMGASHNRWYVERKFMRLADSSLSDQVAQRIITEASIKKINIKEHLKHVLWSITEEKNNLHKSFQAILLNES